MPIIVSEQRREFSRAPEGLHQAVCIDVVDIGIVTHPEFGSKHQVEIRWHLEAVDEASGLQHMVMKRYNLSMNEKATLRLHLEAWRGRKFTTEELKGFDLEKLIGVNCQIQVVHKLATDGRTWANVMAIVPLGKGMTAMRPSDTYVRVCDREKNGHAEPVSDGAPF